MRLRHLTGWFLVLAFASAPLAVHGWAIAEDLSDEEITKRLVGKWEEEVDEDGIKGKVTIDYKKDGKAFAEGTLEIGGQNIKIKVEGSWKVSAKELVFTFDKVEPEGLVPVGTVSRDKILTIDEKSCTYRDEQGKERKMTRLKD